MVDIFRALAEESRLRILSLMLEGELCVCEIEACLMLSQSNTSRHLTVLKRSGILESYKDAQWTYYRIDGRFIQANRELWEYLKRRLQELPSYPLDSRELQKCKEHDLCDCHKRPREKE